MESSWARRWPSLAMRLVRIRPSMRRRTSAICSRRVSSTGPMARRMPAVNRAGLARLRASRKRWRW